MLKKGKKPIGKAMEPKAKVVKNSLQMQVSDEVRSSLLLEEAGCEEFDKEIKKF